MKLAISNIAWRPDEERMAAALLRDLGIRFVEIAPTTIWPRPLDVDEELASSYRVWWQAHGVEIVAMQSLLFGVKGLALFKTPSQRRRMLKHLEGIMRLASWLGAKRLVFGSPDSRRKHGLSDAEANSIAIPFFSQIGEIAKKYGVWLCLEPLPTAYGCDFLNTVEEAVALVRSVNQPGFRLHLDTGELALSRESPSRILPWAVAWAEHFHISEPFLEPFGKGGLDHPQIASILRREGWDKYVSLEMRNHTSVDNLPIVRQAITRASAIYGNGSN